MQITDVRVRVTQTGGKLRGYAAVTFDNCFAVHNIKILEGANGLFLAMPSRETTRGDRRDVAHPINNEFRDELETKVLDVFHEAKAANTLP
ncbi:MAG: septation regulator SpoVG [Spirochaetaceae bacterium]|jgi:stage V sporulation protein G|nr:septation regulator SpoVG [Spirochaetaceae bacterium]GMO29802.1 MAG: septation regulator SpoVG [Termitinemataceae bacterium]